MRNGRWRSRATWQSRAVYSVGFSSSRASPTWRPGTSSGRLPPPTQNSSWRFLLAQAYQRSGKTAAAAREFAEARRLKEQEILRERK